MNIAVYYNLPFGGAKRAVQAHVSGLRARGHVVDVYTTDQEHDLFDPGKYANNEYRYVFAPRIIRMPGVSRVTRDLHTIFTLPQFQKRIAAEIDGKSYDIVLVHHDVATNSPYLLRFLKTHTVYYCMEPLRMVYEYALRVPDEIQLLNKLYEESNRYIRKTIDRTNARAAEHTIAISYFCRDYMQRAYSRVPHVVQLGVDPAVFKPVPVKKKNQVLFLAEKEAIYGYDFAVAALNRIPESVRPALKLVYGTKGKQHHITDAELVTIYNESLVTLSLSKFDTFGLVPLESMACSVPVIAFNVAGYRETILDAKTGYLLDFDAQQIADKILYLMKNTTVAQQMGRNGRQWVAEQWTWETKIAQLEKLFKRFVAI
jgi:glycosyltransferase involved in cell wall biosynthesis